MHRSKIVTRRWLATLVDFVVLLVLCGAAGAAFNRASETFSMAFFFGVPFVYYVAMETAFGRTVGKFATGIVVIDANGARPGIGAVVIRTLTRIVEVNPVLLGGLPAGIIADRSVCRQRWGDMLADTYVVFRADLATHHAKLTSQPPPSSPTAPH
jgi:uncharacterized RDD family membrane protein YckC